MGCGASRKFANVEELPTKAYVPATTTKVTGAVLIVGASGITSGDVLDDPDCYVCARVAVAGTRWGGNGSVHRSVTVSDRTNPVWNLAFSYDVSEPELCELQLRVFDRDLLTSDDFLCQASIPLSRLRERSNERHTYALVPAPSNRMSSLGDGASVGSSVVVMEGSSVEEALLESRRSQIDALRAKGSWSTYFSSAIAPLFDWATQLGWFFSGSYSASYWTFMFKTGISLMKTAGGVGHGRDAISDFYLSCSRNSRGEDTYEFAGPYGHSITYSGQVECQRLLNALPQRFGTSNGDGECERGPWIGFQRLNHELWSMVPWQTIGLGAPQEAHAWLRPLLMQMVGPRGNWTEEWLARKATAFFEGRTSVDVNKDMRIWVCELLHEMMFGLAIDADEAEDFLDLQFWHLLIQGQPEESMNAATRALLGVASVLERKLRWLERYKVAVLAMWKHPSGGWSEETLTAMAATAMDALMFAGGASIPTVLAYATAIQFSSWAWQVEKTGLPADFMLDHLVHDKGPSLSCFLYEVVRRFAPVSGFCYTERNLANGKDRGVWINLHMAQRDPRVWGDDAGIFRIRSLEEYHRLSVGFAEMPEGPNAHSCPAKDLAIAMSAAWIRAFVQSAAGCKGGSKEAWVSNLRPDQIDISLFKTTMFVLTKS